VKKVSNNWSVNL